MTIVFEQVALLFAFIFCGWILGKSYLIDPEHSRILSTLCVYLFLPCNTIKAFSNSFNIEKLKVYYPLIIVSALVISVLIIFGYLGSRALTKDSYDRKILLYTLIIPNFGYMGYALAEGIFGSAGLLDMIIYAIPFNFFTYSVGYCVLTGNGFSFKRFLNPPLISVVLGMILGLFSIDLPGFFDLVIDKSAACMAPTSMLLAGITISEFPIKKLVTDKLVYFVTFLRLILIPFLTLIILKPLCEPNVVRIAVLLCSMPCGMNTIVFPKLVGENCELGAKLAFVSNILALATVPLMLKFI